MFSGRHPAFRCAVQGYPPCLLPGCCARVEDSSGISSPVTQYETEPQMTGTRHRNAWIWVAIAAITLTSMARAQAGIESAKAYADPVLEFLTGSHGTEAAIKSGIPRLAQHRSARESKYFVPGLWTTLQPVLFIGLVRVSSPKPVPCVETVSATPHLPSAFQRPPPLSFV